MKNFDHQTRDFERARDLEYFGLLWEQGCGKTRTAIQLAENHYKEGRITACMVITTKGLVRNWSDEELPVHAAIPYSYDIWPNRMINQWPKGLYYWLVNVDALRTDPFVKRIKEFINIYPNFMCIVDESTLIKTPGVKRTKRAWRIGQYAKYRLIMTGLPNPRSPLDSYAQCKFLTPGKRVAGGVVAETVLGFDSFAQFKMHHANISIEMLANGRTWPKIESYKNLGELKEKMAQFTSIVKKADCLDLPPTRHRIVPVPLTKEQQHHYDELREEMLTIIKDEVIEAPNVISMINKCLQLCSGQMKLPTGEYLDVPTDRLDVLKELVEECETQTIVWTAFVHNATAIGRSFGKDALLLPAGLSLDQRQIILGRFRQGEGKILVANPASAGHGITLTNCSNVIHYSRSFNFEHRAQSDARVHRIGQTQSVLYTDLCDPDTMEKKVINILNARREMSDFMLDGNFVRQLFEEKEMADA